MIKCGACPLIIFTQPHKFVVRYYSIKTKGSGVCGKVMVGAMKQFLLVENDLFIDSGIGLRMEFVR